MKNLLLFGVLLGGMILGGCKKDTVELDSPIPYLELVEVTPTTISEFTDSILVKLYYRDGDGDLGENDPSVENLFVIDNRIGIEEGFRIPQLAPDNATITIAGTLEVYLPGTGITDNSSQQTFRYNIFVRDRAGNASNQVESPDITVVR